MRSWYPPWTQDADPLLYGRNHSCSLPDVACSYWKTAPLSNIHTQLFHWAVFWPFFYVFFLSYEGFETPHCQHERSKGGCNRLTADYRSVSSAHAHWPGEQSATEGLRSRDLHKRQQRRSQGALTWTSKVNKLSQWNNLHITCHVSLIIGGFLKTKEMISAPAVSAKDKLNRSQQSLQQSLANAVPAYYLNQPSNVPSPLSFPLHIPLLTSFLISKSLPLSTNCVHGNRKMHMKYCMDAGYT